MVAQALAPGPRIAKGRGLFAIHKANVTVALLFQRLNELKKGGPFYIYTGGPWNNRRSLGG